VRDAHLSLVAAGIAFFSLLSLFPALAVLMSVYGFVADPQDVTRQVEDWSQALPPEARALVTQQLRDIAGANSARLGLGVAIGTVIALWSASTAMKHLLVGLGVVFPEREQGRGYAALRVRSYAATLGAIVFMVPVLFLLTAAPALGEHLGGSTARMVVSILRWPVLLALFLVALAVLYRYGAGRPSVGWRSVTRGATIATAFWAVGSVLFSMYVSHFGSFGETYGNVAAVAILMLWLYLTAFCVLLGGAINSELERGPHESARIRSHHV